MRSRPLLAATPPNCLRHGGGHPRWSERRAARLFISIETVAAADKERETGIHHEQGTQQQNYLDNGPLRARITPHRVCIAPEQC